MSKKKKKFQESTIENYYDLKVDKVDELVSALKDDNPTFEDDVNYAMNASMGIYDPKNVKRSGKDKKFDPYKTDFLGRVPTWLKALFVKFWFAGAVCYFIMWGLHITDSLDRAVLVGFVLGVIVELFVNPIFRFMESDRKEFNPYMMFPFPFKAYWTFFTNIIYYILVDYIVAVTYTALIGVGVLKIGVEPLLFGIITLAVDMVFIGIKDGVVALVRHLGKKKKEKPADV